MRLTLAVFVTLFATAFSQNKCPDPSYQVNLIRALGPVYSYTPANMQTELAGKKGAKIQDEYSAGCVIHKDKLDVFREKCPDWKGCLAPLCYVIYTETNGNPQYRLRPGIMPDNCVGSSVIGYVIIKYDCCDANAPLRELFAPGNPDWWLDISEKVYNGYVPQSIPFFVWPIAVKPQVCPDRTYMVPIVRTYSGEAKYKNNYFFLLDDMSDWQRQQQAYDYRLEFLWISGCAIRKDRLEELEFACPKYKKCVKPLCSARWKDPTSKTTVFRLEPGDWEEPFCGDHPHIGYIPTKPGCCGANTLLYTLIRNKYPLPGYHHSALADEVAGATRGHWSIESQHFYVWPTIAM